MIGRAPTGFKIFFAIVVLMIIGGFIFNVLAYQECRSKGLSMIVCSQAFEPRQTVIVVNPN